MAFDRQAAKAAGYSDQEIDNYLRSSSVAPAAPVAAPQPVSAAPTLDREAARKAGYTDQEINDYLRAQQPQPMAPPAPKAWSDHAGTYGDGTLHNIGEYAESGDALRDTAFILSRAGAGLAAPVDLPILAAGKLAGAVTGFIPGMENISHDLSNPITIGGTLKELVPDRQDTASQFAGAIAEGLGSVMGGAGVGKLLVKGGSKLATTIGEALMENLPQQFAGAASGSVAAEAARQSGLPGWAQLGAGLVGGVAPWGAGRMASATKEAVANHFTNAGAERLAAHQLTSSALDPQLAIQNIDRTGPMISGASPTLAEASLDPGLAGFQRSNISRVKVGAAVNNQIYDNNQLRAQAANRILGPGSPEAVRGAVGGQQALAAQRTENTIGRVGAVAAEADSGARARGLVDAGHDTAKQATGTAYNAPELTQITPVDVPHEFFGGIRNRADQFYGDLGGEMPPKLQAIIGDMASDGMNSRGLTNLDRRLADFSGEARVGGRNKEAAFAESLRSDLNRFADSALPQEQRDALAAAKAARRQQGDTYETGSVGRVTRPGEYGNPALPDSKVPQALIPKGAVGAEAGPQLEAAVGRDQALTVAREELRRRVDAAAAGGSRALDKVKSDYAPILRHFPELSEDVTAAAQRARMTEAFQKTPMAKIMDPNKTVEQHVEDLLNAKDDYRKFRILTNSMRNDPQALTGLRRSLANITDNSTESRVTLAKSSDDGPVFSQAKSAPKLLEKVSTILDADKAANVLEGTQRQAMLKLKAELQRMNFANTSNGVGGSDTVRNALTTVTDTMHGFFGGKGAAIMRLAQDALGNGDAYDKVITQALTDPKYAASLLRKGAIKAELRKQAIDNTKANALGGMRAGAAIGDDPNVLEGKVTYDPAEWDEKGNYIGPNVPEVKVTYDPAEWDANGKYIGPR